MSALAAAKCDSGEGVMILATPAVRASFNADYTQRTPSP